MNAGSASGAAFADANTNLGEDFRKAMRCHAGAVTIIATEHDNKRYGMTATAFTSLSAAPPTILACVNRTASLHNALTRAQRLCVNILAASQEGLATAFSSDELRRLRFCEGAWEAGPGGLPFLSDAHAVLFCEIEQLIEHTTHTVLVARVFAAKAEAREPLVYHGGRFHRLAPLAASAQI